MAKDTFTLYLDAWPWLTHGQKCLALKNGALKVNEHILAYEHDPELKHELVKAALQAKINKMYRGR